MTKGGKSSRLMEKQRHSMGARFGLLTASVFALATWGLDGVLLWNSSSTLPWLKFLASLPLSLGSGALAGWLTARFNRYWVGVLVWFFTGLANAWLALHLPFEGASFIHGWLNPAFRDMDVYPFVHSLYPLGIWVAFGVALFFGLVGWGEIRLLPAFVSRNINRGVWAMSLLTILLMIFLGLALDRGVNHPLRQPIQIMDHALQNALAQKDASQTKPSASPSEETALQPLEEYMRAEYRLTLGAVNPRAITQSVVYVNWGEVWGNCFVEEEEITSCQLSLDRYVKPLICVLAGGMQHECGIQVVPQALEQVASLVEEIKGTDVSFEIFSQRGAVVLVRVFSDSAREHLCALREQARITLQRCIVRR